LREEFDRLTPENKQAGVKVQQILLKVARKDLDAQVEQKGEGPDSEDPRGQSETREKVFADLARGNSEDPATAKSGGYLPRPVKRNPNKVDGLYDARLTCKRAMFRISRSGMRATGTFLRTWRVSAEDFEERSRICWPHCATAGDTQLRQLAERDKTA